MEPIPNISESVSCEIAPSVWASIRMLIIETRLIPALSEIMSVDRNAEESIGGIFFPLRALVISQNPDGTFAVLSDLAPISPEASRSTATHAIASLIEFDPNEGSIESVVRTLLALVEPVRQSRTNSQYITDAQRGAFDELAKLYAGDRVDPRKRVAASAMLPTGQLAPSTFQRICKALSAPKKKPAAKNNEAAATTNSSATESNCLPKPSPHRKRKKRQPIEKLAGDGKSFGPEVQGELF